MTVDTHWNMVPLLVPCSASPFVEARHAYTVSQGDTTVTFDSGVKPSADFAGSAYFSGVTSAATGNLGTQLRLGSTDDFTLGNGDFTIEAWISSDSAVAPVDTGVNEMVPHTIVERGSGSGGSAGNWSLQINSYRVQGAPDTFAYKLSFYCVEYAAGSVMLEGADLTTGTFGWVHVAVTRNGDEWTLWRAGMPDNRVTSSVTIVTPSPGADIRIGNSIADTSNLGNAQPTTGRSFNGYIAGVRITKGYCRYGRSFEQAFVDMNAAPGLPFPETEDTGDYTGSTFTGPRGAQGANATGEPQQGPDGEGGAGIPLTLPAPALRYDQQNEDQCRRLIEAASRRA